MNIRNIEEFENAHALQEECFVEDEGFLASEERMNEDLYGEYPY